MSLPSTAWRRFSVVIVLVLMLSVNVLFFQYNDEVKKHISVWNLKLVGSVKSITIRSHITPQHLPGHLGESVKWDQSDREISGFVETSIKQYGFNEYASSLLSTKRVLPDLRYPECVTNVRSNRTLPKTSIVIVFYNEPWSVLLRTVHSVLDNSPSDLVEEVLLVDDCSYLRKLNVTHGISFIIMCFLSFLSFLENCTRGILQNV